MVVIEPGWGMEMKVALSGIYDSIRTTIHIFPINSFIGKRHTRLSDPTHINSIHYPDITIAWSGWPRG